MNIVLLKVAEVAERLACSEGLVYKLVAEGKMPHHKLNAAIRISEDDLLTYVASCRYVNAEPSSSRFRRRRCSKHFDL